MRFWFLLLLPAFAYASGDCRGDGSCVEASAEIVTGDTVVQGDSSRAFGFGLGDVDINQCYRSYQILIWQDTKANRWCMADGLDARGLPEAAARMRCSIRALRSLYPSESACIAAVTVPNPVPIVEEPREPEDDERDHEAARIEHEALLARISELETALERDEQRRRAAARRASEEKEYARQALAELEKYR